MSWKILPPVTLALFLAGALTDGQASQDTPTEPSTARQQALVHIVRQDCGSCHGMRLRGGLGPPLTAETMRDRPLISLVSTILQGRLGTPMPGWNSMLNEADAQWIARQLQAGFPEEHTP